MALGIALYWLWVATALELISNNYNLLTALKHMKITQINDVSVKIGRTETRCN